MAPVHPEYDDKLGPQSRERELAALATRQHGVVSIRQLLALGFTRNAVLSRARKGRLHGLHRGVYAVGHLSIGLEGRQMAAILACGRGTVLSHRSAAVRLGIVQSATRIEVTAPHDRGARPGITVHRTRNLAPADRDIRDGIPLTTPARTLVDLAEVLHERRLADAVHQAEVLRLLDLAAITDALARVPGRSGGQRLARVLDNYDPDPPFLRNDAEKRFLRLIEAHDLPTPQVNAPLGGFEIDFYWPEAGLAVEVDGGAAHHTRQAFHEDRRRDRTLAALHGIQSLRVTWRDLDRTGDLVAQVRQILSRRARGRC